MLSGQLLPCWNYIMKETGALSSDWWQMIKSCTSSEKIQNNYLLIFDEVAIRTLIVSTAKSTKLSCSPIVLHPTSDRVKLFERLMSPIGILDPHYSDLD